MANKKLCCRKEAARCFVSVQLLYTRMVFKKFEHMFIRFDMIHSFHVSQPTFLFPLETPLRLSCSMLHGWKDNLMLAKPLTVCTYLSSIVFELYDA